MAVPVVEPAAEQPSLRVGVTLAMLGALGFAGKAIIVKLAYRHQVDAVTLLFYRMAFALPLFLALSWWAGRDKPALTRRDFIAVSALGFSGYYLASFLDFLGLQDITASLERLILYLNPTLVAAFHFVLFKRRLTRQQLLALLVSYAGVLLVFGHETQSLGPNVVRGAALVFASAVSYALYLVYSGEEVQRLGATRLTGLASTAASVFCIAQFFAIRPVSALHVASQVLWLSVFNAVFCTFVPVLLVMVAISRIGATLTAQTGMLGPVATILMGVLILDEPFSGFTALGSLVVIAGIWLFTRGSRR